MDTDLFLLNNTEMIVLDEVEHVPDILPYLKREIYKNKGKFKFFISGSQHFALMKGVTESLSGRAAILDLWPFSAYEIAKNLHSNTVINIFNTHQEIKKLIGKNYSSSDNKDIIPSMLKGGYPPVAIQKAGSDWFESYRRTYIQRDIRDLSQVGDLGKFDRFLILCAGRTGSIVNKSEIGQLLSVDNKTVDNWSSILETSYQMIKLPAYHAYTTKRIAKRTKWIFGDIGLALHLQGLDNKKSVLLSPHFGNLFESFIIMELRKLFAHTANIWNAYYFRTAKGLECDLVFEKGAKIIPVEIKHAAKLSNINLGPLKAIINTYPNKVSQAFLISMYPKVEKIHEKIYNIPVGLILGIVGRWN